MIPRLPAVILLLISLTGLYPVLRHDLYHFYWRQGREALSSGDNERGLRAFAWAERLRGRDLLLFYDVGVAFYRRGEYAKALARFSEASTAVDPGLKEAALYNAGNATVKEAERKGGDAAGAAALLRQAEASYRQALELNQRAADAKRNLELVRARLAGLAAGKGDAPGREARGGSAAPQAKTVERQGGVRGKEEGEKSRGSQRGTESEQAARHGRRAAEMSREDAERLLAEERGRETLAPQLFATSGKGRHAPAGKEW